MRSQLVNSDGDKWPFLFRSIFFSLGTFWKCLWTTQGTFRQIPFLLATLLEMELEECGQLGDYSLLARGSAELEVKPFPCLRACFCCSHSVGCVTPKSTGVSHHTWFCWSILLSPMVSPPPLLSRVSLLPWITWVHAATFFLLSWDRRTCSSHLWIWHMLTGSSSNVPSSGRIFLSSGAPPLLLAFSKPCVHIALWAGCAGQSEWLFIYIAYTKTNAPWSKEFRTT